MGKILNMVTVTQLLTYDYPNDVEIIRKMLINKRKKKLKRY